MSSSAGALTSDVSATASQDKLRSDYYDWGTKLQTADHDAPAAIKPALDDAVSALQDLENGAISQSQAQNQTSGDESKIDTFYGHNC